MGYVIRCASGVFAFTGDTGACDSMWDFLNALPRLDMKRVVQLAEKIAPRGGEGELQLALDAALAWVSRRLAARSSACATRLAPLVEVCDKVDLAAR